MIMKKIILPATILIASAILGGFYYVSQLSKQKSIEKQQQIELQAKTEANQAKLEQENQEKLSLQICLDEAYNEYKKSALYWIDNEDKIGVGLTAKELEKAKVVEQQDKDNCYKQYK